jgi:hypothetical protein
MRFLVDRPLEGLAKWLRLCGFDAALTSFSPRGQGLPGPAPGTYLVTRQTAPAPISRDDVLVLTANDPENQLAEIFRRLQISRVDLTPLSRCGACNDLLVPIPREQALGSVPDHIFHTQAEFSQCPRCGRFYWPGSHPPRITAKLQQLFAEQPGD